jgi:hypothetical protein
MILISILRSSRSQKLILSDLRDTFEGWFEAGTSTLINSTTCGSQSVLNAEKHAIYKSYILTKKVKEIEIHIDLLIIDHEAGDNHIDIYIGKYLAYRVTSEILNTGVLGNDCGTPTPDTRKTIYFRYSFSGETNHFVLKLAPTLIGSGILGIRNLRIYDDSIGFPLMPIFTVIGILVFFSIVCILYKYKQSRSFNRLTSETNRGPSNKPSIFSSAQKPLNFSDKKPNDKERLVEAQPTQPDDLKPQDLQNVLKYIQDELDDEDNYHNRA